MSAKTSGLIRRVSPFSIACYDALVERSALREGIRKEEIFPTHVSSERVGIQNCTFDYGTSHSLWALVSHSPTGIASLYIFQVVEGLGKKEKTDKL